ncbi:MAG: hypothetical protein EOP84_21575 [Verrucomicrobiaceae bacterium]|nr:MAG: hypothetical protein EOP84_21575 [Verrucomicrobiaceae bacterium]
MKRKAAAVAIVLLATALVMMIRQRENSGKTATTRETPRTLSAHAGEDCHDTASGLRTKSANRGQDLAKATHSPQRLREFVLSEVAIEGLALEEALEKLRAAYQDACLRTGEKPLLLVFTVPAGTDRKLHIKLPRENFSSSVHLLATLSGMKAIRNGTEYRFEPIASDHKAVARSVRVAPDFSSVLQEMAGIDPENRMPLREILTALGLDLDPSTRLSLNASGVLQIDSSITADAAAITTLIESTAKQKPFQHKFTARLCELTPESQVIIPETSVITEAERLQFQKQLSQKAGVTQTTLPSVTNKSGREAEIVVGTELIWEKDGVPGEFEKQLLGHVVKVHGEALGFGHDVSFQYTNTTGDIDPVTKKPVINRRTDISNTGFSGDQTTRVSVQTRPDGSRVLFLLDSEMIDVTGRPIRPKD